ncbi:leader peptidase (prepilin peptidase) / N-methyltransferase [Rhizobiales bacterium GAS191]|nr:leader peptidase (prepilin peptidase) / N-methyltransferase [Rhizobiales bacterium GAS191]
MEILSGTVLICLAAVAAWIDIQKMILPNWLNIVVLVSGLIQSAILGTPGLTASLVGVLVGASALGAISTLYRSQRGFDGLGLGDVKFVAASGAWLGWAAIAPMLLVASVLGLAFACGRALLAWRFDRQAPIPFGPFLAVGMLAGRYFPIL